MISNAYKQFILKKFEILNILSILLSYKASHYNIFKIYKNIIFYLIIFFIFVSCGKKPNVSNLIGPDDSQENTPDYTDSDTDGNNKQGEQEDEQLQKPDDNFDDSHITDPNKKVVPWDEKDNYSYDNSTQENNNTTGRDQTRTNTNRTQTNPEPDVRFNQVPVDDYHSENSNIEIIKPHPSGQNRSSQNNHTSTSSPITIDHRQLHANQNSSAVNNYQDSILACENTANHHFQANNYDYYMQSYTTIAFGNYKPPYLSSLHAWFNDTLLSARSTFVSKVMIGGKWYSPVAKTYSEDKGYIHFKTSSGAHAQHFAHLNKQPLGFSINYNQDHSNSQDINTQKTSFNTKLNLGYYKACMARFADARGNYYKTGRIFLILPSITSAKKYIQ